MHINGETPAAAAEPLRVALEAMEGWIDQPETTAAYDAKMDRLLSAIEVVRAALAAPAAPRASADEQELRRLASVCPELNLSNYTHDDVDELNGWAVEVAQCIDRLAAPAAAAPAEPADTHAFKNFHRALCERFGYVHDEVDWRRDQVSLIEWIAKAATRAAAPAQPDEEPYRDFHGRVAPPEVQAVLRELDASKARAAAPAPQSLGAPPSGSGSTLQPPAGASASIPSAEAAPGYQWIQATPDEWDELQDIRTRRGEQ